MMITKIDHWGIAVKSLAEARRFYENASGLQCKKTEEVASPKVRISFSKLDDIHIKLLGPTVADSPIVKFIESKGEGFHNIAYKSNGISTQLNQAGKAGCQLIHEKPIISAGDKLVVFLHQNPLTGY